MGGRSRVRVPYSIILFLLRKWQIIILVGLYGLLNKQKLFLISLIFVCLAEKEKISRQESILGIMYCVYLYLRGGGLSKIFSYRLSLKTPLRAFWLKWANNSLVVKTFSSKYFCIYQIQYIVHQIYIFSIYKYSFSSCIQWILLNLTEA